LADTLEALAHQGRGGFYRGPVAQKLVDGVRSAGGIWTLADLSDYRVIEREPIRAHYRSPRGEMHITSAAPPSSGGITLATMFNILSGFNLDAQDSVTRKHLIIEAMRRAYRDRAVYLGDPDFTRIPVERLLHPFYADGLRAAIRSDRALPSDYLPGVEASPKGRDTTHFSILDREGNRVAATLTINYPFGSGFVSPGTGVLLNDEMDDFSARPGTPNVYGLVGGEANAIAPGKRPLSSMSPSFLHTERGVAVVGTPGGSRIISMLLLAALDFEAGGDARSMVGLPRFHHQYLPDVVHYETAALNKDEIAELGSRGHTLREFPHGWGNMQAVVWDKKRRVVSAATDPRVEGAAATQ
ncbi:MAG TPA: gamma-glutamyltransferase, partial [Chromatiales bacterium]|nr:gamma-glutamyltransferase [Chromatiales bacterium]HEX22589.1 gamma-glutamyltransferase [Chromatiales bacterium]